MVLPLLDKEERCVFPFNWALQPEICQAFRDFEILRYRVNWVFVDTCGSLVQWLL